MAAKLLMTDSATSVWHGERPSRSEDSLADRTFRSPNLAPELALLGVLASLWGASYTFIKVGVETIPPVTLITARTLIAGCILLLVMRLRGIALPTDRGLWLSFLVQAAYVVFPLVAGVELLVNWYVVPRAIADAYSDAYALKRTEGY